MPRTEHMYLPLPSRGHFFRHMRRSAAIAAVVIGGSLVIGMAGYHWLEGLDWIDSFLNASMILSGMGPANELHTISGKLFAGCYAIFSGVVFITTAAVLIAPVVHRFLHKFHLGIQAKD